MKKFLKNWFTDNRKAGLMRWWLAGMCYFMIGFGTQVGGYSSPIDFIFFLGVEIGRASCRERPGDNRGL